MAFGFFVPRFHSAIGLIFRNRLCNKNEIVIGRQPTKSSFCPVEGWVSLTTAPERAKKHKHRVFMETIMGGNNSHVALLGIGVAAGMLFCGAVVLFRRERSVSSFLQLIGAGCLIVVVLIHVAEALRLFPSMQWGRPHRLGHYVDFGTAVLAFALFPIGYLSHALSTARH